MLPLFSGFFLWRLSICFISILLHVHVSCQPSSLVLEERYIRDISAQNIETGKDRHVLEKENSHNGGGKPRAFVRRKASMNSKRAGKGDAGKSGMIPRFVRTSRSSRPGIVLSRTS
jgi:hypothetical protein